MVVTRGMEVGHFLVKTDEGRPQLPMPVAMSLKNIWQLGWRLSVKSSCYAIGVARPVSILVETFGTGKVDDERLLELVLQHLNYAQLIIRLSLLASERGGRFYQDVAAYGHLDAHLDLPWERTDKAALLKEALSQSLSVSIG